MVNKQQERIQERERERERERENFVKQKKIIRFLFINKEKSIQTKCTIETMLYSHIQWIVYGVCKIQTSYSFIKMTIRGIFVRLY